MWVQCIYKCILSRGMHVRSKALCARSAMQTLVQPPWCEMK